MTTLLDLLDDLKTPRPGPVDPEGCPVCGSLRAVLSRELKSGDRLSTRAVVYAMYTHMIYGHPQDSRTLRRADG